MLRPIILAVSVVLVLTGCARVAESRLNPFNWFGGSEAEDTVAPVEIVDVDPRPRIAQITALAVERTPTGAIVRATGLPPSQGWHSAALVPVDDMPINGVMTYVFRAVPPESPQPSSTVRSREITAARTLSVQQLAQTRSIRVEGALNARTVRR